MPSSTHDYLQALRAGQYLLFLEWPQFVSKNYQGFEADKLQDLLIFEWLNNGFNHDDVISCAKLHKVQKSNSQLFQGNLSYAIATISSALFCCMSYHNQGLQSHFIVAGKMSLAEVNTLMTKNSGLLSKSSCREDLEQQKQLFYAHVDDVKIDGLDDVVKQLSGILKLRNCMVRLLEIHIQAPQDALYVARRSVSSALSEYVHNQSELTDAVKTEVISYVQKIRNMQPSEAETTFLDKIFPLTQQNLMTQGIWSAVAKIGTNFFNLLQQESSDDKLIKEEEQLKKEPQAAP